jgi:hypothetical protein
MQDFLDVPFDTANEEASTPLALIPRGQYEAEITSAMAGPTKNGKGYSVALSWTITKGEYENRTVFQNILIQHESEEAAKIGRGKFKDVLIAVGITESVTDLNVLLHRPCTVGITIRQDKNGQYPDRNEIGRVVPLVPHNGPTRDANKEAQKVPAAFTAVNGGLNDKIPFAPETRG